MPWGGRAVFADPDRADVSAQGAGPGSRSRPSRGRDHRRAGEGPRTRRPLSGSSGASDDDHPSVIVTAMEGLTRLVLRHRYAVLASWLIVFVVAGWASSQLADLLTNRFTL